MPEGYITESEVTYLQSKLKQTEKFNEVFNFYHETVPRETTTKTETVDTTSDDGNNGVQTLDPAPEPAPAPAEEKTES